MPKTKELVRTNIMMDKKLLKEIDEFAKALEEDRSTAIRQLVKKSLSEEKTAIAVKKYQEGLTFRKAAELSNLDYWEFQAELDKRGIPVSSSLPFAKTRLRRR
jgi:predicted HTH domain antitoxin